MVSFAYTCAIFTVWALGLLGATGMVTLVSAAGCVYTVLAAALHSVLQYASALSCRCRPGPAGKPQLPAGWRGRGLL